MSILGIDIGTTGCKAAAYSSDGRCIAMAYREYSPLNPLPLYMELDSRAVSNMILKMISEMASKIKSDPITAICTSSLGEALTPISKNGKILHNSIISSVDTRGGKYLEQVIDTIGKAKFFAINPNIPAPAYSLASILWYKYEKPEVYNKTYKFLLWGIWLHIYLDANL